jgi:hypothetical protein
MAVKAPVVALMVYMETSLEPAFATLAKRGKNRPMVKLTGFEAPPLGAGLVTVTAAILAVVMAAAGIAAVNCEGLTNVVARATPAKFTTEPVKKFEPFTVRVKAAPPVSARFGEIVVIVGPVMVNVKELEAPPPGAGLKTVMAAVPATAMSLAGI